jgi:hypothetical protein
VILTLGVRVTAFFSCADATKHKAKERDRAPGKHLRWLLCFNVGAG